MNRTCIKICGVSTPEVALAAVDAGADYIGMVFVDASPRNVSIEQAKRIAAAIGTRASTVGVFTDAPTQTIRDTAAAVPLNFAQLHRKSPLDNTALAPLRVIRAVAFDPATIGQTLQTAGPDIEALLIDTPDPTKLGGGTGRTFDWSALRTALDRSRCAARILLAGGLTPQNVADAVRIVRPWAVDVSSGVESSRGVKNIAKIRAFCDAVKNAGG